MLETMDIGTFHSPTQFNKEIAAVESYSLPHDLCVVPVIPCQCVPKSDYARFNTSVESNGFNFMG